jgi:hypothetical protein
MKACAELTAQYDYGGKVMKSNVRSLVLVVALCGVFHSLVLGQTATGGIRGVIRDDSDGVVRGATITVTNKGTGVARQSISDETGSYQVSNLLPGEYEIKVELPGLQTQVQSATVLTGANANADFKMTVGSASEVIQVESKTAQVNLTEYKIDGVVTREQIENLPLNGRSFLQLAMLEPGVDVTAVSSPGTQANNFFRVSIGGAGQQLTRISVDGATVNDRVTGGTAQNFSQESVQEFQITTFNFDLATSLTGVGSVNVVSRTGTNDIHGSGFFFFRDHNMSAYPGLKREPANPDPFFARRQSGFYLGGPLKKDKLFWFTNFENNNQTSVQTIAHGDPVFRPYDHIGQAPFRGKQFNARVDYVLGIKHFLFVRYSQDNSKFLSPNNNLESNWIATRNVANQGLLSLTSVLTSSLVNDVRFSYQFYSAHLAPPSTSDCTHPFGCAGLGGPQMVISDGGPTLGNNTQVPQKRLLRTYQLTDNVSWQKGNHRIKYGGEWEHFFGTGDWGLLTSGQYNLFGPTTVAFLNPPLYATLPASLRGTSAGAPTLADITRLPLAVLTFGVGDIGQPPKYNIDKASRNNRYRAYFQDAWRIHPRFVFNYGVAYSYEDNLGNHDLDKPEYLRPVLGGAAANLGPTRRDPNNVNPVVGFAWGLDRSGRTVIRGGAGIYHDSNLFFARLGERQSIGPRGNGLALVNGQVIPNPFPGTGSSVLDFRFVPTYVNQQLVSPLLPTIQNAVLQNWGDGTDLSIRGIEVLKQVQVLPIFQHDSTVPYTAHITGGVQREIARDMVLQGDFVMRRAVHFGGYHDLFPVDENRWDRRRVLAVNPDGSVNSVRDPLIPVCQGAQGQDPKAQCSQGQITVYRSAANYRYTALLAKLDKRFSSRYQFTVSYAFSRYTGFNGVINNDNLNESYGIQGSDRPHRFTFSGIWNMPSYGGDSAIARGLLNSWQLSAIHQMVSAPPLNPELSLDIDGDGISRLVLPGMEFNGFGRSSDADDIRRLVDQFNKTMPTSVTGMRTPQNQVVPTITLPAAFSNGDTFFSTDVRLTRVFSIRERIKLQFMAEAFNLFNVANLSGYGNGLVQTAAFGQPTVRAAQIFGTGGPRAFQLGARLSF